MDKLEFKAAFTVDETGAVEGVAWPFGSPDRTGDTIIPEAFANAVGKRLPMLAGHSDPIGVWESVAVDGEGLKVKGRLLIDEVPEARTTRALVREGAVTGLSIGFLTKKSTRTKTGRTITDLDLVECSIVAVPANSGARVTNIKDISMGEPATETVEVKAADLQAANDNIAALTKRLEAAETKLARPGIVTGGNEQSPESKAFGDYLRSGNDAELKTLQVGSGTGGVLAPDDFSARVIEGVAEFSPIRNLASVISIGGPLLQIPVLDDEVTPAGRTEVAAAATSEPTFTQVDIKPFEMAVKTPVSQVLLEDSKIDLSGFLANHIARRFGQLEATWFVTGNGTSAAEGVLTSTAIVEEDAAAAAAIAADELIDLYYSIKSAYAANGSWLMNRKTMAAIRKLKDTDGTYLWQPAISASTPPSLLGRPVYEGVDMPDIAANASPVLFGDFAAGYTVADRIGFNLLVDNVTGAENGIVNYIARRRVGGKVTLGEALAKLTMAAS